MPAIRAIGKKSSGPVSTIGASAVATASVLAVSVTTGLSLSVVFSSDFSSVLESAFSSLASSLVSVFSVCAVVASLLVDEPLRAVFLVARYRNCRHCDNLTTLLFVSFYLIIHNKTPYTLIISQLRQKSKLPLNVDRNSSPSIFPTLQQLHPR